MKQIVATTLCLGALLGMGSSAQAITFTFNAGQTSILPVGGTSAWRVSMTSTDFISWTVNSITAVAPGQVPGNVNSITFTFFDGENFTGSVLNGIAGGSGGTGTVGVGNPVVSPWTYDVNPAGFSALGGQTPLQPGVANAAQFSGAFTLAGGPAKSMIISLQGQPQQWQGQLGSFATDVTPELPGSALLSVALLPLGLVLRKRMA
jgi:hypothetical protein